MQNEDREQGGAQRRAENLRARIDRLLHDPPDLAALVCRCLRLGRLFRRRWAGFELFGKGFFRLLLGCMSMWAVLGQLQMSSSGWSLDGLNGAHRM